MALSAKQQRFVAEYLIDLNATQAAIRAGYSKRSANQNGPRMLVNAGIAAAIARGQGRVAETLEITAAKVLSDLEASRLAASKDGQHSAAIRAAELQGKQIGMFVDRRETVVTERYVVRAPEEPADAADWASKHGPH